MKEFFDTEIINNKNLEIKTKESYFKLSNLNIKNYRNLVKKPLMTIPFNVTTYAIINYLKEEFIYSKDLQIYVLKKDKNILFNEIDFLSLTKALNKVLYKDFPKLDSLLKYFKTIAHIANTLGCFIPWSLPTGLLVKQQYYGDNHIELKPFIYSKNVLSLKVTDKTKFNNRKQTRALMPNLVHSLDAASLGILIDNFFKLEQNKNFYSVHDCFAVTCNNVSNLNDLLKISYYKIYSEENYILTFDKEFKNLIKNQFGPEIFSEDTNIINFSTKKGKITLQYPDILKIINTSQTLDFTNSSYLSH